MPTIHAAHSAHLAARSSRKSNSERGKEFRARRKQEEASLVAMVSSLRREVADLNVLHGLRSELSLRRRHDVQGSLVRASVQYLSMFSNGAASAALYPGAKRSSANLELATQQESFLRSTMDPDMQMGSSKGWQPLLEQWRRYTAYHASFSLVVTSVDVCGPEESPVVTVGSDLRVVFSPATFEHVFPHAAHDRQLVAKLCGRTVTYKGLNKFHFSKDGRIVVYDADVGFVDALMAAGASIADLAVLMNQARIANEFQLGEDPQTADDEEVEEPEVVEVVEVVEIVEDADDEDYEQVDKKPRYEQPRSNQIDDRLDVRFLLS